MATDLTMSSFDCISIKLLDHLGYACKLDSSNDEFKKRFLHDVYHTYFNLITDSTQSPEIIIHLIDIFTSHLKGLFREFVQSFVAFACFEGLAKRRTTILDGPWETLVWVIGKHSLSLIISSSNLPFGYCLKYDTIKFIMDYSLPELCPNPFLRLELLKFIKLFNCNDLCLDEDSLRKKIIISLCESFDSYISLNKDQVPNLCPLSLQYTMNQFRLNMRYITYNYDIQLRRSKIIPLFLKLSREFALLGMVEPKNHDHATIGRDIWFDNIQDNITDNITACISFCGLIPGEYEIESSECLEDMIQEVGSDSLLKNYVIDILEAITQMSHSITRNIQIQLELTYMTDNLYDEFVRDHIKQYPAFQHQYEMNGGMSKAEEYRITYFWENCGGEIIDSDSDSEFISNTNDQDHNYSSS